MSSTKGKTARTPARYGLFIADHGNHVTLFSHDNRVLFNGTAEALFEVAHLVARLSERQRSALAVVRIAAVEEQRRTARAIAARKAKKAAKLEGGVQ